MTISPNDLRQMIAAKREADEAEQKAKRLRAKHRELEAAIWDAWETSGEKNITIDLGGDYGEVQLQRRETIYGRIIDRERLLDFLESSGRADELTRADIEKRRLNELVRECIENNIPLPEGADFYAKRYISVSYK